VPNNVIHPNKNQSMRFLTGLSVRLSEGSTTTVETVTRAGRFYDPRYGWFDITKAMLLQMVDNFSKRTYGQDIYFDVAHKPDDGGAAKVLALSVEGNRLRAKLEWTEFGIDAVRKRGFRYLSADFVENYMNNETGEEKGALLRGAGLTLRPVIKNNEAIQLSEGDEEIPTFIHPELLKELTEEINQMKDKFLKLLSEALAKIDGLTDAVIKQLSENFDAALDGVADDAKAQVLLASWTSTGKTLAEAMKTNPNATIQLAAPQVGGPTLAEVEAMIAKRESDSAAAAKQLTEQLETNVNLYKKLLNEAEGLKELPDDQLGILLSVADSFTADMPEITVRKLAEQQIELGNKMTVSLQLAQLGYQGPEGSPRITVDDSNSIKELQENIDKKLGITDTSDSRRFANTGGQLPEENKKLAEKFLAVYDQDNAHQLRTEAKLLAAGDGVVSDVAVPATFERTVIREALYRLVGLQFVNSDTLPFASSHLLPYSYRDLTAAGRSNTRVYEGGSIPRAGVIQTSETAYAIPQKISFEVSDELRYLTSARHINWDSVIENQQNAVRIIHEDTEQLIFNEVLHSADEYQAVPVVAEDLGAATDASNTIFVTTQFPVVHPRKVFDLQGSQVGNTSNTITITLAGTEIEEYTGQTAAATYYVMDYNLGEFYFIDESQAVQTPGSADALTISYSYATNVYKFDTDLGGDATDVHWDKFLYRYGLRKNVIEDERYHQANFGLMSGTAMTQIEQAKQFGANSKRNGTDLAVDGNLGRVKDVGNYKASAPGLWMGDQRIIVGERGQTRLRMMKPWSMGELENQKDANGRFTGKKEAYGDQYILLHTPTQLKRAYTSIVNYSATGRVAR